MEPKKTSNINAVVPDELKKELREAVSLMGMTESSFLRGAAEALIFVVKNRGTLTLPIRLMTVAEQNRRDGMKM